MPRLWQPLYERLEPRLTQALMKWRGGKAVPDRLAEPMPQGRVADATGGGLLMPQGGVADATGGGADATKGLPMPLLWQPLYERLERLKKDIAGIILLQSVAQFAY